MEQVDLVPRGARRHLKAVRDFAYHLMVYMFVNAMFVVLDVRGGSGDQPILGMDWAYWIILFWGFGLVGHAIWAFLGDHRVEARYEEERHRELISH